MITTILQTASNDEISNKLIESFSDVQKNYHLDKHRYSGLEAGHFVESVRRFIELKLFGTYTPLTDSLPRFHQGELQRYEQASGNESYKILIPRALFSIYTLRNRRGIGHSSAINASKIDTNYILTTCKWVLAEIVRLESNLNPEECGVLVNKIVEREIPLIWKTSSFKTISSPKLNTKKKALIYLLDEDGIEIETLQQILNYSNKSVLKQYIKDMKKSGFLHIHENKIYLSPLGQKEAERVIINEDN